MPAIKKTWKKITNRSVRDLWKCPDPDSNDCKETAIIRPSWYEQHGTPVCTDCDCDMEFQHTEVKV